MRYCCKLCVAPWQLLLTRKANYVNLQFVKTSLEKERQIVVTMVYAMRLARECFQTVCTYQITTIVLVYTYSQESVIS